MAYLKLVKKSLLKNKLNYFNTISTLFLNSSTQYTYILCTTLTPKLINKG